MFEAHRTGLITATDAGGGAPGGTASRTGMGQLASSLPVGIFNPLTGMGQGSDRATHTQFVAVEIIRPVMEAMYAQSWAAAKMINIPIFDMWVRGRRFQGEDAQIKTMKEAVRKLRAHFNLARAMIAGRLFGTSLLIIVEKNKGLETEFDPEQVEPDGIAHLWVVDRWSVNIDSWVVDVRKERYGQPYMYQVTPRISPGPLIPVHHSRCLRFDGRVSPVTEGWHFSFNRDWGIPYLQAALFEIARDTSMHAGISQLIEEASVFVMKAAGFKASLAGRTAKGYPTVSELAQAQSMYRSMHKTLFIDQEDDATRVSASFAGLPQLLNEEAHRLSAIADIPFTRFMMHSPAGMNATGESDARNYAIKVASDQEHYLTDPLLTLDMALARHAGLEAPPEYEWLPLFELTEKERAETAKLVAEAMQLMLAANTLDENEVRERLAYSEIFGELGELPTDLEAAIEEARQALLERARGAGGQAGSGNSGGNGGGGDA